MKKYKIGIIGGSGVYTIQNHKKLISATKSVKTYYKLGLEKYLINGHELYFIARHWLGHLMLPHEIDYKKLIKIFYDNDVDFIISFCTVGSLSKKYLPGHYIIPKDVIDFTKNRIGSDYVLESKHIDINPPFEISLVKFIKKCFNNLDINLTRNGVIGIIEGPRFSTYAEQKMFKLLGCDFLNMTQMPEIYLAHAFSIPYISLCHVTDLTSLVNRTYNIKSTNATKIFKSNVKKVEEIVSSVIKHLDNDNILKTRHSLESSKKILYDKN